MRAHQHTFTRYLDAPERSHDLVEANVGSLSIEEGVINQFNWSELVPSPNLMADLPHQLQLVAEGRITQVCSGLTVFCCPPVEMPQLLYFWFKTTINAMETPMAKTSGTRN